MSILRGLTYAEYEALPGVRWSSLKSLDVSPLLYHYMETHPRVETPAMRLGSGIHCAALEPDAFPLRYEIWDGGTRRGKEWDAFCAMHADKVILKADEYATCLAVRDAIHANRDAAALLRGESEVSVQWTDAATGIACKARLDHVYGGSVIDLKSTASVDKRLFEIAASKMEYAAQLAFYVRGLEAADPDAYDMAVRIIAVEQEPPHDVLVGPYDAASMRTADQLVSDLLFRLGECTARDEWPGRYDNEVELSLPAWRLADETADGWGGLA